MAYIASRKELILVRKLSLNLDCLNVFYRIILANIKLTFQIIFFVLSTIQILAAEEIKKYSEFDKMIFAPHPFSIKSPIKNIETESQQSVKNISVKEKKI